MTDEEELLAAKAKAQAARVARQPTKTKVALAYPNVRNPVVFATGLPSNQLADAFEDGQILVFDDFPIGRKLGSLVQDLQTFPVWPDDDNRVKKAKYDDLVAVYNPKGVYGSMGLSNKEADVFRTAVLKATGLVEKTVEEMFPTYRWTGDTSHSWRITETFAEGLHVDSYRGQDDEQVRLRVFYNYDVIPRLWTTAGLAPDLIYHASRPKDYLCDLHPNAVNAELNKKVAWPITSMHRIFFAPGTLWICDSQLVSHEIVYGRRGWAYTFGVDPKSLRDPEKAFQARMRKVLDAEEPFR